MKEIVEREVLKTFFENEETEKEAKEDNQQIME
jgi:hypothetical protein